MAHFIYTRKEWITRKDEKGKPIPVMSDTEPGKPQAAVPGVFEKEEKSFRDSFNLKNVVRSFSLDEDSILVLLDDGHEEVEILPAYKKNNEQRKRVWVTSQINLIGEDVNRFFEAIQKES